MMSAETKKPRRPGIRRGVSKKTIENVAAKMEAADKANTKDYHVTRIPVASIQLWDEQPRDIYLTIDDVIRGWIEKDDPLHTEKEHDLIGIVTLAISIKDTGMNNPPIAYSLPGQRVRLIGGQRRTMAMIYSLFHIASEQLEKGGVSFDSVINETPDLSLLESTLIPVKVFVRKPDPMMIEKIGMADNLHEGLTLKSKLNWALRITERKEADDQSIHWSELTGTIGVNRSQAFKWVKVLTERSNTWVGKAIDLVKEDKLSFSLLAEIAHAEDKQEVFERNVGKKRPPVDGPRKHSIGVKTTNLGSVKKLIFTNLDKKLHVEFDSVDWSNPTKVKKAFIHFFDLWEQDNG